MCEGSEVSILSDDINDQGLKELMNAFINQVL